MHWISSLAGRASDNLVKSDHTWLQPNFQPNFRTLPHFFCP